MSSHLPDRQQAICERLRQFRIGTLATRAVIARRIGLEPERLATYENARAPIRWEIALPLARVFRVNLRWLVTGEGPQQVPFNPGFEKLQIKPKTLLTTAFDQGMIFPAEAAHTYSRMHVQRFVRPARVLSEKLTRLESVEQELRDQVLSDPSFVKALSDLEPKVARWLEIAQAMDGQTEGRGREGIGGTCRQKGSNEEAAFGGTCRQKVMPLEERCKEVLTPEEEKSEVDAMAKLTPRWAKMKERLKTLTRKLGGKSALAEKVGVTRQTVHSWLNGEAEPSAEKTLRLIEILAASEDNKK